MNERFPQKFETVIKIRTGRLFVRGFLWDSLAHGGIDTLYSNFVLCGYSLKPVLAAGEWIVEAVTQKGLLLGSLRLFIPEDSTEHLPGLTRQTFLKPSLV